MSSKTFKVAIIAGSQRPVQAGQRVTDWVQAIIEKHMGSDSGIELQRINLLDVKLPLSEEPATPHGITSSDQYAHERTRAWSKTIKPLDGVVVVTPEYNYGQPAGLKNAVDLLYNEWQGKPVAIMSYGVNGGNLSNEAFKRTFGQGVRARTIETAVMLPYGPMDNGVMFTASSGADFGLSDKEDSLWADKRPDIRKAWDELVALMNETPKA